MIANVNEQMWLDFDLNTAVFLDTIAYWIKLNAANKSARHFHDGRYWTYNTYDGLHVMFPGWSRDTIRGIVRKCVKNGLLIVDNFNLKKYDRTCWYTLTDKAIDYYPALWITLSKPDSMPDSEPSGDFAVATGENTRTIPKKLPSVRSYINITISDVEKVVSTYHETLPDSPKIKVVGEYLTRQIHTMIKNWPKYQKEGNKFTLESFKDYLTFIQSKYPWFLQPYATESGKIKQNNLRNITRENNIVRIVNGEFSVS